MASKSNICVSKQQIISAGGNVIENSDGTISVYTSPTQPYYLTKQCCEFLSSNYYFDIVNQTCRWATPVDCTKNNNINVILNPKGNDGTIFSLEDTDNCFLEIEFDYLLQFSCSDLALLGVGVISGSTENPNTSTEKLSNQTSSFENSEELTNSDCDYLVEQLAILNNNLENTPYSVELNDLFYCLTEDGLINWSTILGPTNYNNFLNGDLTTYTNTNVQALINNEITSGEFLYQCNVDPTSVGILKTQISDLESEILVCQNTITTNEAKIIIGGDDNEVNLPYFNCTNAATALESLNLSFCLDIYDDINNKITTVYENNLLNIGEGNLFNYLSHSTNSGLLICGDSGCTSSFVLTDNSLTGYCRTLSIQLMNSLIAEAASSGVTLTYNNLINYISTSGLSSNWINYSTTINNPSLLTTITNKKIKISLKLKNTCLNVCILLDNIKINRVCETVDTNSLLISKNPSFEINKIIDNKKSWVSTENRHNREFDLTLRETDYNINDYRLAINTKEVDLNISSASAIENDVWCYMTDNNCILTGICTGETAVTCGDGCIDLTNLLTTSLSSITTIELFEDIITSELIDAKSRKTISAYPTLRLLYDRYINSSLYCGNESSKFSYLSMDKFASLIGTYWVDLIEQVVPSTTLWGSTYIYKNTIFDIQKFEYKTHNTFFCEQPTTFPFSGIGSATTVQVLQTTLTNDNGNIISSPVNICNGTYIMKRDCGSEFIGTVKIIGALIVEEGGSEISIL